MRPIPILLYHSVDQQAAPNYYRWDISPKIFREQMVYLCDHGYQGLTIAELMNVLDEGEEHLPEHPVVITFDDGLADFMDFALPILQENQLKATLYVTTGFVGKTSSWLVAEGEANRQMLTWNQIRTLQSCGIEIGAHSRTHPQLDVVTPERAWDEILGSRLDLEDQLGQPVRSFAYPHGYHGPAIRRLVQMAGYTSACGVKHAMSSTIDDRFSLARIIISPDMAGEKFGRTLLGESIPMAWQKEKIQTKGWRWYRRVASLMNRTH